MNLSSESLRDLRTKLGTVPGRLVISLSIAIGLTLAHTFAPESRESEWGALVLPALIALSVLILVAIFDAVRKASSNVKEMAAHHRGAIESLAETLRARDDYTHGHSSEVADMVEKVAVGMGMGISDLENLRLAALLHDVGKVGIPDPILQKPGPLTDEEREVMEQHPEIGARILAPLGFMEPVLEIVLAEHERWDGKGYPRGLSGEQIPLGARIIFVCDAYHAMTSDRPYRKAAGEREAIRRLRESSGSQFDPMVVNAFIEHVLGYELSPQEIADAKVKARPSLAPTEAARI